MNEVGYVVKWNTSGNDFHQAIMIRLLQGDIRLDTQAGTLAG